MTISEKIYKPPKWLFCFSIGVFIFVTVGIFMIREISFTTIFLLCMAILSIIVLIELLVSKVEVNESAVLIVSLFKKDTISIAELEKAKIENHELFLYLKNGELQRMPYWFTGKISLNKILSNRLKKL